MADDFKLIGITLPDFVADEARLITLMLTGGISRVHIRKPHASASEVAALIESVPQNLHCRLSLHYHHELIERFPEVWPHLNSRNPLPPAGCRNFSRSCHSFEELTILPEASYSFLSPVFDSISKSGYASTFSANTLRKACSDGIIDRKVIALGGVTPEKFPELKSYGFGGAAMLGYLWGDLNIDTIKKRIDVAVYHTYQCPVS